MGGEEDVSKIRILTGQGIGDSVWAMFKVQSIAKRYGADEIQMLLGSWHPDNIVEKRGVEFIGRFDFVKSCRMHVMPRDGRRGPILTPGGHADDLGRFCYIEDGPRDGSEGFDFVAIPNRTLEYGIRLEDWLPEFEMNWDIIPDHWRFKPTDIEYADNIKKQGDYAVVYFGPRAGNGPLTRGGHNRGQLWTGGDWLKVIDGILSMDLRVVATGASYDIEYYTEEIEKQRGNKVLNLIGASDIGETLATLQRAKVVIAYQSGIAVMASYLGVPTATFWRPEGNSIYPPPIYVSFDERMAHCWTRPGVMDSGCHYPAIYGRHGPQDILAFVERVVK